MKKSQLTKLYFAHDHAVPLLFGKRGERFGGAEVQIVEIAQSLVGHEDISVIFLTQEKEYQGIYGGIEVRYFPLEALKLKLDKPTRQDIENLGNLIVDDKSSVFIQTIATPFVSFWQKSAQAVGAKFIYRISSDADIEGSFIKKDELRKSYLQALRDADFVIAQSHKQQSHFSETYHQEACLIPKGLSVPNIEPSIVDIDVLWAGRAVQLKRPQLFLSFAREFPHLNCVMLLASDDILLRISLITQSWFIKNLKIIPDVPYLETWEYFARARLFMGTSLCEGGAPVTYLQAYATGTPVASFSVGFDTDESESLNISGHSNWDLFTRQVCDLLQDDEALSENSAGVKAYFDRRHGIEACGERYAELLRSIS